MLLKKLSTDDLPGVAGAGVPNDLKLRRARRRATPSWWQTSLGGEKNPRAAAV